MSDVPLLRVFHYFVLLMGGLGSVFILRLHVLWIKHLITFRWWREKNIYFLTPYGATFDIEYDDQSASLRMTGFCLAIFIAAVSWSLYEMVPRLEPLCIWLMIFSGLLVFGVILSLFFKNPSYRGLIFRD